MAAYRALSKPPIHEAIIDVQVVPAEGITTDGLRALVDDLRPEFPTVEEVRHPTFQITFGSPGPSLRNVTPDGFVLKNSDQSAVIQLRTTNCACSFVGRYEGWEVLEEFFKKTFEKFVAFSRPLSVGRVGVRFINLLPLPSQNVRIQDYLPFAPELPADGPQAVNGFQVFIDATDEATRTRCTVRQAMVEQSSGTERAFLLDIDAYHNDILEEPTPAKVAAILGTLRKVKNVLFFGMVSEKALEPYS